MAEQIFLDVRELDEFKAEHIEHSIHVPLSQFTAVAPGVLNQIKDKNVVIMCRSGNRAKLAAQQIDQLGYGDVKCTVFEGGILRWKQEGHPTVSTRRAHLPIMRQVQLIAGLIVLTFTLLGAFVNPLYLIGSAFVGAGLTVAGTTGFCGMALLLAYMPWNRTED